MTGITLAAATPAQASVVAALHAATIAADRESGWSADWVSRLLALPGAIAAVALVPEPAGFVLALPAGETYDIAAIGVSAGCRRYGIGGALVAYCALRARAAGARRLMLEVAADNDAAIYFYRQLGFTESGRRPNYYRKRNAPPLDALIFSKELAED
jgi:ribosomal-protein-alanine N-acetyltransferase